MFHKTTLPSGLRLIVEPMAGTKTVTVLVTVATGSKYELESESGLSHFLEHLMFKGTKKRPSALAISETLDAVGGEYNAFTGKEETAYYAKVAGPHFGLALDVISDMLLNSLFDVAEVEREKGVIIEEMNMYQDTPMRFVSDIFEELLYGDTPAGRFIIGTKDTVRSLSRDHVLTYYRRQYSAPNIIVTVAGACQLDGARSAVSKAFAALPQAPAKPKKPVEESQKAPALRVHTKQTDQMHLRLGVRTFPITDRRRFALEVMGSILGGGMSSRLFINVRERQGLAYYVNADNEFFTDHGYLVAQAGVRSAKLEQALLSIGAEFKRLVAGDLTEAELTKAKEYIKGKALLGLESSEATASFLARQEVLLGKLESIEQHLKHIEKVSIRDIKEVAASIFKPGRLNLAVIGPVKESAALKQTLNKVL